jgi:hypothetical protein
MLLVWGGLQPRGVTKKVKPKSKIYKKKKKKKRIVRFFQEAPPRVIAVAPLPHRCIGSMNLHTHPKNYKDLTNHTCMLYPNKGKTYNR